MKLSVVIVARNEEKNIKRCIESVLIHTASIKDVEVLLVDSASTDRTVEIALHFPINIISLRPEWSLSPAAGRFTGVNHVTGEYLLIIDGDMELLKGWVEEALNFLSMNLQVAAVVGKLNDIWLIPSGKKIVRGKISSGQSARRLAFIFGSSVFRRDMLMQVGNFQPFLRAEEEAEVSYRLTKAGYELFYLPYEAVNHYGALRWSFAEFQRRLRSNLWAGMGDMLSWCLKNGYYKILWQRFCVFLMFFLIMLASLLSILVGIIFKSYCMFIAGGSLFLGFFLLMFIKKGSLYSGMLSIVNMAYITWSLMRGLVRKVPAPEKYPRDIVWVKKAV
ncbi:MAG: glycosyltransferase family A protein [Candidatus Omnitrophota bacterium]